MYSKTIIVGRVGGDVKMYGDGKVASFSVAVDRGYGEKKTTEWYNVKAFTKLAETCQKYVTKGKVLVVEGELETSEGKDGKKYTSLLASRVQFLPGGDKTAKREAAEPADDADVPF